MVLGEIEGKAIVLEELEGVTDVNISNDDGDCTVLVIVVEISVDNFDTVAIHVCWLTALLEVISNSGELFPFRSWLSNMFI